MIKFNFHLNFYDLLRIACLFFKLMVINYYHGHLRKNKIKIFYSDLNLQISSIKFNANYLFHYIFYIHHDQ